MYGLALILPPLAILLCGRPFQAIFSCFACLCGWLPGALWATLVVSDRKANARMERYARMSGVEVMLRTIRHELTPQDSEHRTFVERDEADEYRALTKALVRLGCLAGLIRLGFVLMLNLPRLVYLSTRALVEATRRAVPAAMLAYHDLPEWAQPIVWGLAIGSLPAIILTVVVATHR